MSGKSLYFVGTNSLYIRIIYRIYIIRVAISLKVKSDTAPQGAAVLNPRGFHVGAVGIVLARGVWGEIQKKNSKKSSGNSVEIIKVVNHTRQK